MENVKTDLHELVKGEVGFHMKPFILMVAEEHEQTRNSFKRLEDLVIRRRLFYRKVILSACVFIALILLTG